MKKSELGIGSLLFVIFLMMIAIGCLIYWNLHPTIVTKIVTKNVTMPCTLPQGCNLTSEKTLRIKAQNDALIMRLKIDELQSTITKQLDKIIKIKNYAVDTLMLINITRTNLKNSTWNYTENNKKKIAITAMNSAERNMINVLQT